MPVELSAISRFLKNNRGLKLLSLALAIAAWNGIRKATSNETLVKDIPLKIVVDESWAVLDQSVATVDVLFSGSLADLRNINREQLLVEVDRRGKTTAGSAILPLSPKQVRGFSGARPVRLDPADVRIIVDRESDREVAVKADIVGSPPEGIEVERVVCTPATVKLRGPQQRLAEVETLLTVPIDLEGRVRSFQLSKPVKAPSGTWTAKIEPESVRVEVALVERLARREIPEVVVRPLAAANTSLSATFNPSSVAVTLEGPAEALKTVDVARVVAFVDCAGVEPDKTAEAAVRVSAGSGFRAVAITPPAVQVTVSRSGAAP